MKYRKLGKTGWDISEVSLGTWQLGGKWGQDFDEKTAMQILERSIEKGINLIDTADVYNDGLSEKAIGRFLKKTGKKIYIATKAGRKLVPHNSEGYNRENISRFVDESLKRLDLETIDLLQLHCPPTDVYGRQEVFDFLEDLKSKGKIQNYGVSVEKVEEALRSLDYTGVATVQIIYNMFRLKPAMEFFDQAHKKDVGIIVRVPLASGLLTGKLAKSTRYEEGDHRYFNRKGLMFDRGETFSGIDYEKGLKAVGKLKKIFPDYKNLAPVALKWILNFPEVSCIIPGASRPEQVLSNLTAEDIPELTEYETYLVHEIYEKDIKPLVHHYW